MKFELHSPWPIHGGATVLPTGTILVGCAPTWGGHSIPTPLPLDAWPLDNEAADQMRVWYGRDLWHRFGYGPLVTNRRS
jgi:hypothetical protein